MKIEICDRYIVRETRLQAPVIIWLTSAIFFEKIALRTAGEYGGECGKQGEFCPYIATIPPKNCVGFETARKL